MKIEVNITKKYFFIILSVLFVLIGLVAVQAYNAAGTGGNAVVMGHSVDEIDWTKPVPNHAVFSQSVIVNGPMRTDAAFQAGTTVNALGSLCINGDCKSSWNQIGKGQLSCYQGNTGVPWSNPQPVGVIQFYSCLAGYSAIAGFCQHDPDGTFHQQVSNNGVTVGCENNAWRAIAVCCKIV